MCALKRPASPDFEFFPWDDAAEAQVFYDEDLEAHLRGAKPPRAPKRQKLLCGDSTEAASSGEPEDESKAPVRAELRHVLSGLFRDKSAHAKEAFGALCLCARLLVALSYEKEVRTVYVAHCSTTLRIGSIMDALYCGCDPAGAAMFETTAVSVHRTALCLDSPHQSDKRVVLVVIRSQKTPLQWSGTWKRLPRLFNKMQGSLGAISQQPSKMIYRRTQHCTLKAHSAAIRFFTYALPLDGFTALEVSELDIDYI